MRKLRSSEGIQPVIQHRSQESSTGFLMLPAALWSWSRNMPLDSDRSLLLLHSYPGKGLSNKQHGVLPSPAELVLCHHLQTDLASWESGRLTCRGQPPISRWVGPQEASVLITSFIVDRINVQNGLMCTQTGSKKSTLPSSGVHTNGHRQRYKGHTGIVLASSSVC